MFSKIKKRDGRIVPFDASKIREAIRKAIISAGTKDDPKILTEKVIEHAESKIKGIPTVEEIQDCVEEILIQHADPKAAKAYIIYRKERASLRIARSQAMGKPVYSKLSVNAIRVLKERYLRKDEQGNIIETPDEMFWRVANNIAQIDKKYNKKADVKKTAQEFYEIMANLDFLPNSPTLMNAGLPLQQLSGCFVLPIEDSLDSIFDTLKTTAKIHQSGGGCIRKGAKIFTTFCGIESIDVLYDKLKEENEETNDGDKYFINLENSNICTISFNSKSCSFEKDRITKIWKYDNIKEACQIITSDKVKIETSNWHPFFVFEKDGKIKEKRADEIVKGDLLITPQPNTWLFKDYNTKQGIKIDENVGWLIGYYIGNGSIDYSKNGLRLRFFDGRADSLKNVQRILKKFDIDVKIQKDGRGLYSITTTNQKFVKDFLEMTCNIIGEKSDKLFIPQHLIKSPLTVVSAFIAGLIDSDGYVDNRSGRVQFTCQSKVLAEQLSDIVSLMGLNPSIRRKEPYGRGKSVVYEVTLSKSDKLVILKDYILKYMNDPFKISRLKKVFIKSHDSSESLKFDITILEPYLNKIGIKTKGTKIHKKPIIINGNKHWLHRFKWGLGINKTNLVNIIEDMISVSNKNDAKKLSKIKSIVQNCSVVRETRKIKNKLPFYDFTVEKNQNYLAGVGGFTVIHNTGFSFTKIRPRGDLVKSTHGVASGPVSFLRIYDATTEVIKQGGRRRGANMCILKIDHPDILEFISCKEKEGAIANFNISVGITDKFMKAVEEDKEYDLINPRNKMPAGRLRAREIFNLIALGAWKNGEPGVVFLDTINKKNPTPELGEIEATNPCAEQPLLPYESCVLGSINLSHFVRGGVDWERLGKTIHTAVHFLDNVIDANKYPTKEIKEATLKTRKIGLGVMGFADMLVQLGIKYDSEECLKFVDKLMKFFYDEANKASHNLAVERGAFPAFRQSIYATGKKSSLLRNAYRTTIAPTGSISMIADCSAGIEPLFAVCFVKKVLGGQEFLYVNEFFEKIAKERRFWSEELMRKISNKESIQGIKEIPEDVRNVFVASHDISPQWHVKIQGAFQKYVDSSISKTINFPSKATLKDVEDAYWLAYRLGCKGLTVYRDRSRESQVINVEIGRKCPSCKTHLRAKEGCMICEGCGYSMCILQ